jgi:thiamine-monophosphate kinase
MEVFVVSGKAEHPMLVGDSTEFDLIRVVTGRLAAAPAVLLGPGDDAAVIAAPDGRVVASTDLMVEGRHFRRDWSPPYDVGRKAAACNLADIVAMGARPTALLVGFGCPPHLPVEWVERFTDGLRDESALLGAVVAGGDIVRSEVVTVAVTALGDLEGRSPVTRSGARPGDVVLLAGSPGRAAAGLALLHAGHREHPLVAAHQRPQPAYAVGLVLASEGVATSMIDISDGLMADLGHVARASDVRIELVTSALPLTADLRQAGQLLDEDPLEWVTAGGDDHCFAATLASGAAAVGASDHATVIGQVRARAQGESAGVDLDGTMPSRSGHDHFRS